MPGVVAVGFFDGVHLGHRRILKGADAALTFRNHPSSVLRPESAKTLLMPYSEKEEFIRSCGVKNVIALEFTPELASMPPEKFIDFIRSYSKVRCGADWRFGKGAKGDAEFLRGRGFEVEVVPYAELDGERISSTRIRAALEKGDLNSVNRMLGRNWRLTGAIVRGKGVGRELGYPTVNLEILNSPPEYGTPSFGTLSLSIISCIFPPSNVIFFFRHVTLNMLPLHQPSAASKRPDAPFVRSTAEISSEGASV